MPVRGGCWGWRCQRRGMIVVLVRGEGFDALPVGLVVAGWAVLVPVIVARDRHHRQRMAEGDSD